LSHIYNSCFNQLLNHLIVFGTLIENCQW